eukprot:TRINITY_DN59_c0_g2_i3.p1 TRINITY_DN59_c0_g2~~TRINITY_DN59_c0_g2_i3.p1  ORF type:complete len:413 (-),score=72.38 TRINITY_DN59_c0_g2_i3:197-1435(-)
MSLLPKESIKSLTESVGLTYTLSDDICAALASDVEFRLREITQEAVKFMRHSKREILSTDDVNAALRLRNVETLYGYSSSSPGSEPLRFRRVMGAKDLFYLQDRLIDFNELLKAPLPKVPRDISLSTHWLAIEGVQPAIPQNPTPADIQKKKSLAEANKKQKTDTTDANAIPAPTITTEVRPIVKHVLSKELQLYFEKIVQAIKGTNVELLEAALNSLVHDPSLHQLLPYFTQFISDEVTQNLQKLPYLLRLMKMARATLESEYLYADFYLHQLMPPIITCVVARSLCEHPSENHWELREFSANLLALVCKKYGSTYQSLQPRITKTLFAAFRDASKSLTTHYGAIVGMRALGHYCVETLLLPNIPNYYNTFLAPELTRESSSNIVKKQEAQRCYEALISTVGLNRFLLTIF